MLTLKPKLPRIEQSLLTESLWLGKIILDAEKLLHLIKKNRTDIRHLKFLRHLITPFDFKIKQFSYLILSEHRLVNLSIYLIRY